MAYFLSQGKTNPLNLSSLTGGSGISTGILDSLGGSTAVQSGVGKTFGLPTGVNTQAPSPGEIDPDENGNCPQGYHKQGGKCLIDDPNPNPDTNNCPTGQHWDSAQQKCVADTTPTTGGDCGKGPVTSESYPSGKAVDGCPCTAAYYPTTPGECQSGYHAVGEGADARCECDKYTSSDSSSSSSLGEYSIPSNIQSLLNQLLARGNEYMTKAPGYDQDTLAAMLGSNLDQIRGAGNATRQDTQAALQRAGLSGTGAGLAALNKVAANTEANVGNTMRDLYTGNEVQKKTDLANYTDAAQKIANGQLTAQQLVESINSGRRGEGQASLNAFLQYLMSLMSSYNQA